MSTFNNAMTYGLGYYGSACGASAGVQQPSNACGSVDVHNAANVMLAPMTLGEQSQMIRKMANMKNQKMMGAKRDVTYVDPATVNPAAIGVL